MADFWGGFGKGFAPAFEKAWESAEEKEEAERKLQQEAAKSKNINMANALKAFEQVTQAGGDPKSLLPLGTVLEEGGLPSDWVKSASEADLLAVSSKATPIVSELQRVRTQREATEKQGDMNLGAAWTNAFGVLEIPEKEKKNYPEGSRRRENLYLGSSDLTGRLSEKTKQDLAYNSSGAETMLQQIDRLTFGAKHTPIVDMDAQNQAYYTSERGMKEIEGVLKKIQEYHYHFKEAPSFDVALLANQADLRVKIRDNQEALKDESMTDEVRATVQNGLRDLNKELSTIEYQTQFNLTKLTEEINEFKKAKLAEEDMDEWVWKSKQPKASARVADFRKLIQPTMFENGKGEHQIIVGEGDKKGNLYDKTYFTEVKLPGSDRSFLDVKPEFRSWLSTYTETIPQFFGLGADRKEYHTMNPTGVPRAMIYYPPPTEITKTTLPDGKIKAPGKPAETFGPRDLKTFWKERPEMLGAGKMEREKVRALYGIGPDGNIEVPAAPAPAPPKVFEEKGDLKRVPRRGEPRAEVDEAAKILSAANASDDGAAALNVILGQATAEEIAEINMAKGVEEKQLETLRKILKRLKGLEK